MCAALFSSNKVKTSLNMIILPLANTITRNVLENEPIKLFTNNFKTFPSLQHDHDTSLSQNIAIPLSFLSLKFCIPTISKFFGLLILCFYEDRNCLNYDYN